MKIFQFLLEKKVDVNMPYAFVDLGVEKKHLFSNGCFLFLFVCLFG